MCVIYLSVYSGSNARVAYYNRISDALFQQAHKWLVDQANEDPTFK